MCRRYGISWDCGHAWRHWERCPVTTEPNTIEYDDACPKPYEEGSRTPQNYLKHCKHPEPSFLRPKWCCSPECCQAAIDYGGTREMNAAAGNPRSSARRSYLRDANYHATLCVSQFVAERWAPNSMRVEMGHVRNALDKILHINPIHLQNGYHNPDYQRIQDRMQSYETTIINGEGVENYTHGDMVHFKKLVQYLKDDGGGFFYGAGAQHGRPDVVAMDGDPFRVPNPAPSAGYNRPAQPGPGLQASGGAGGYGSWNYGQQFQAATIASNPNSALQYTYNAPILYAGLHTQYQMAQEQQQGFSQLPMQSSQVPIKYGLQYLQNLRDFIPRMSRMDDIPRPWLEQPISRQTGAYIAQWDAIWRAQNYLKDVEPALTDQAHA